MNQYYYRLDFDRQSFGHNKHHLASQKNEGPFSMTIGNVELLHEFTSEHMRMGTVKPVSQCAVLTAQISVNSE